MIARPSNLQSFIGQQEVVQNLQIAVRSSRRQQRQLSHMLFVGPAGVGKTTLAMSVLPAEVGVGAKLINCAAIEKPGTLVTALASVPEKSILFLDEIHALIPAARDYLLTALEDRKVSITIDDPHGGRDGQLITIDLPEFTVVGATTRLGNLDAPTRSRFQHVYHLQTYSLAEIAEICVWHARQRDIELAYEAALCLAPAAQGVARAAVNLVEHTMDTHFAAMTHEAPTGSLQLAEAQATLKRLGYWESMTPIQLRYLTQLGVDTDKPMGLNTLVAVLNESRPTIEDVIEPWLLQQALVSKTSSGRTLTPAGRSCVDKLLRQERGT